MAINKSLSHVLCVLVILGTFISNAIYVTPVSAATITVENTNDSGAGSLRQAFIDATPGDKIVFAPNLSGETIFIANTLPITKNLTIDGSSLVNPITIDGDSHRVLLITTGTLVTITGIIIQNGYSYSEGGGGGILVGNSANLLITDSVVADNEADRGGGIYNDGTLTIVNSNLLNNNANYGGGLYNNTNASMTVINSSISGSTAISLGGGIYNLAYLTVTGSALYNNNANEGGGIYNSDISFMADADVVESTIYNNTAIDSGGGIYNALTLNVTNSTFSGNSAGILGGGLYNTLTDITSLTNCTFYGNTSNKGDGIYNSTTGNLDLINTLIANNSDGADCVNDGTIGINLENFIRDKSCGSDFYGDPMLGPLADNGGPTETHALLEDSPARDIGDSDSCPATDQRGVSRPQGTGCDIGAFEFQVNVSLFLPLIVK